MSEMSEIREQKEQTHEIAQLELQTSLHQEIGRRESVESVLEQLEKDKEKILKDLGV